MSHAEHLKQLTATRDQIVARAVASKKIAADRADDYRRLFDADPRGITRLLTAPAEDGGLVAGINVGGEPFPTPATEYPREWLAGQSGVSGSVAFEDTTTRIDALTGGVPRRAPAPAATATPAITVEP
jgi:hypothetical protein